MSFSEQDIKFVRLCEKAKTGSQDPDRQVGALIVSPNGEILGTGANRTPEQLRITTKECESAIRKEREWKYFMLEHAERNAIRDARCRHDTLQGCTIYGTLFPCADCARAIVAAGITRIVTPEVDLNNSRNDHWQKHFFYARQIFELGGVVMDFIPMSAFAGTAAS